MVKEKMFQLNVHIPMQLKDDLDRTSKKLGMSRSQLIRNYLMEGIDRQSSNTPKGISDAEFKEFETAYESVTIDLEKRVEELEKDKGEKSWIRKKLGL